MNSKNIFEKISNFLKARKFETTILFVLLCVVNLALYSQIIIAARESGFLKIYFLDVGQGDSQLIKLPGNAKILIDAGPPNKKVLRELDKILSPFDRHIDLLILSHPQLDHFGGMVEVLRRYTTSAFLSSGEKQNSASYHTLKSMLTKKGAPEINLSRGYKIRYRTSIIEVMNPESEKLSKEPNLNSLVLFMKSNGMTSIFTGDIPAKKEKEIAALLSGALDVLKVSHHGSKYSSDKEFLEKIQPRIAVIGVGKNRYGHPTKEALERLKSAGARVYRTDRDGTIKMVSDKKKLQIFKIK